jgi:hypothetical protein
LWAKRTFGSDVVPRKEKEPPRGPMIHIRIDEKTDRELRVFAVSNRAVIRSVVAELIRDKLAENKGAGRTAVRKEGGL